jgi:hypothetical protein
VASIEYVDVGRIVGLTVSGKTGDIDAGGGVGEVVLGSLDGSYNPASRLDTEDEAVFSEEVYGSILKSDFRSPGKAIDGIESWSVIEIVESRFWPRDIVITETETPPPLVLMPRKDDVAFDDPASLPIEVDKPTRLASVVYTRR